MAPTDTPHHFFGLDLLALKQNWQAALTKLAQWPAFKWLKPAFVTCIRVPGGHFVDYAENAGSLKLTEHLQATSTKFKGVLLPDDLVLWYAMVLPKLSPDAMASAIALQVNSISPFAPEDVIWGHTAPLPESDTAHVVIASRKIIEAHIASLTWAQPAGDKLEVWVKTPHNQSLLALDGFGENMRRKLAARWQMINLLLVLLLCAMAFAAAMTPTIQLSLRAIQAIQDFTKLQAVATPALQQRERLVQLERQTSALKALIGQSPPPEQILLAVTQLLPDDTYINSLQALGAKISLTGQTPNTATLMQHLSSRPGVRNVRAPSAATKQRGSEQETFNLEFMLDTPSLITQP